MTSASPDRAAWRFPNQATPVGSAAYYAVRFSPAPQRDSNALLFAWFDLIQRIAERPHDPGVARLKLDWWRQELEALGRGQARHPLSIEMQRLGLDAAALAPMHDIIDAAEGEIAAPSLPDDHAFAAACRAGGGNFFVLLSRAERRPHPDPESCVEHGAYCAAVDRVRNLAQCPQRLPADINAQSIGQLPGTQRSDRFETLLRQFTGISASTAPQLPDFARRLTALAIAMHEKMRSKDYPVADTLIDRAPIAHLWTAWRCR